MSNAKGKEITNVFRYVQQVFRESQQILAKTDSLMAPDWKSAYGNRVTKEVSAHIKKPEEWLVQAIFRVYQGNDLLINKGVNISFWGKTWRNLTVDISKEFGKSTSGKSIIIASTEGNVSIPENEDIKIGLNVYRKP
jgi:hypothetical protein